MEFDRINSIKDQKIVFARSLQQRKGRQDASCFLAEGWEQICWAFEAPTELKYILVHDKLSPSQVLEKLQGGDIPIYACTDGILKRVTGTRYLIPAVGVVALKESCPRTGDLCVVLDGVQDFGNIGTIVRTAAAFGIADVIATSPELDLYQRKSIDASRGTVLQINFESHETPTKTVQELKKAGYQIVATALEGSTLQSLAKLDKRPVAIVFGNESNGVSQEILEQADMRVQIPMATEIDSLNVGVAAGISLYELKIKMVMMMLNEKIRGSLGRNLFATARWLRRLFDVKLREVTSLSADQAVVLMILACDESGQRKGLLSMAGIDSSLDDRIFAALTSEGYLVEQGTETVGITQKGREVIGSIWNVHEKVENTALQGLSTADRNQLHRLLTHIQGNLEAQISYE